MNSHRIKIAFAVGALSALIGGFTGGALPANATTASDAFVEAQMEAFSVPEDLRTGLLEKIDDSLTLDSESGSAPISTATTQEGDESVTISRWADGSFKATTIQTPAAATGPSARSIGPVTNSVTGCAYSVAEGVGIRSNCLVKQDEATMTMSFKATYEQWTGGSQIDSISAWDVQTVGATYTFDQFSITRKTGVTSSTPATAILKITTDIVGIASTTPYLQLNVKPGDVSATSSSNW